MNWIKSTKCGENACVEVFFGPDGISVRNSQIPGERVWFTNDEWEAFIGGVKNGEFDPDLA